MCICKLQPWQTATHSFGQCYTRKIISNDFHWLFFWSSLSMGFRKLCSGIKKQVHVFHNFKSCIDLNAALKLRYTVIPFGIGCNLKLYYFNLSTWNSTKVKNTYRPLCPSSVWLLVCHRSVRCPMVNCRVRCSIWCCFLVYSECQLVLGLCFLWSFWLLSDGYSYIHPHLQTKTKKQTKIRNITYCAFQIKLYVK